MITNHIVEKILTDSKVSQKEGSSGKFILKNYPLETFQSLVDDSRLHEHEEILLIVDKRLKIKIKKPNTIQADHEVMAQYRNENVQDREFDLSRVSYIVFMTHEVIDTLSDISTLSPDDIRHEFNIIVSKIENTLLNKQSKQKLQNVCKVFLKDIDEISAFEMEKFVDSSMKWIELKGCAIEYAMGMSLDSLNAFRSSTFFEPLKKIHTQKSIRGLIQPFKLICLALNKQSRNQAVSNEELEQRLRKSKKEFSSLTKSTKSLILRFVRCDERERVANRKKFCSLDWNTHYIYRLFEKAQTDTSKKLGEETIDTLEQKDIHVDAQERDCLLQYDSLPAKSRESLRHQLEPLHEKYRVYIEDSKGLRTKWDKLLYPSQLKSNDFIEALFETIKRLKNDCDDIKHITVSLKQKQTVAIMRNYSKHAINYLSKRYSILNRISKSIEFNFQFIEDIAEKLETKTSLTIKKYKKSSYAKVANELHFIIQAQDINNSKLAERKLIWSFDAQSIMSGFSEDIEVILKHLGDKNLYANSVHRAKVSQKGEKKPLSLFDFSSLQSHGSNSGHRLFPRVCVSLVSYKRILKCAKKILQKDTFDKLDNLFEDCLEGYVWLLKQLDIKQNLLKREFDFGRVEKLSKSYTELSHLLFEQSEDDKFKIEVIEPFLSLVTLRIEGEHTAIIPSYHPLRLISYFVKLKQSFGFLDRYISSTHVEMIKESLYFSDIIQSFKTPYYPEVFRLFDIDRDEESLLYISQTCDDYTILESIQSRIDGMQNRDSSIEITVLTKVIENYLLLNSHKKSSLKLLLHAVNDYAFPAKLMKRLMSLDFVSKRSSFEIYLHDMDASHIRKMYRSFLINQDSKESEDALYLNEVSFLSNIRLNAFDQSFKQLDTINDQINIAFLNDFVSSKAKLEFRKQLLNRSHDLFDHHPAIWSKRKYMTQKESSVGKYLVSPSRSGLTSGFYNLLYSTMSTYKDDYKDKIPTLSVDGNHKDLHRDLEAIHRRTDWVVNLDSLLDKKILEEFGANVIKYRKARHTSRNLVISSKANTVLLKSHLTKKFREFGIKQEVVAGAIEHIITSANELSGDILLKAIGRGSFANEMLGLVLTKSILEGCSVHDKVFIYMDDYADWFLSCVSSEDKLLMTQNSVLADILLITPMFDESEKLCRVYVDVVESKFCQDTTRVAHAKKSLQQTKNSFFQIKRLFGESECLDKEYWLAKISDLIVETHHRSFVGDYNSEDIRNLIRLDSSIEFVVRGMSFVFVHDGKEDSQLSTGVDGVEQYIVGCRSIVSMVEAMPRFEADMVGLELPRFESRGLLGDVVRKGLGRKKMETRSLFDEVESSPSEVILEGRDSLADEVVSKKSAREVEELEALEVKQAVRDILNHHNYKVKISCTLFTPNAVSVSLEAELGWSEKNFIKMSNDFLAVKKLKLLRVEVVAGAYNLVFERRDREIVAYEDCLSDRELSDGSGNTKIVLGRKEIDNEVIYYNLDSEDPHALVAGMTKSGKSVLLNIFIIDLIRTNTPLELKLILIDPKQVEFRRYKDIPYLDKDGIIADKELATQKLKDVVDEMERRYILLQEAGVNELTKYNKKSGKNLPRIVVIFDEFADWMLDAEFKKSTSEAIQRLAGKARAAGIHLIISTQRPDNTVLPTILRANLGAKFALRVDTEKNSNIILDESGAQSLLGYGQMIVKFAGVKQYVQSAYVSDEYIDGVVGALQLA